MVVSGATFTVTAGDKVGLVGRNGAGKTSFLKVLAGDAQPSAGKLVRKGAMGYLSQEPRIAGGRSSGVGTVADDPDAVEVTALGHVLSGRGLDKSAVRLERLREKLEADYSERALSRYARAEEEFQAAGGYEAEADVKKLCAGLGLRPERVEAPVAVLSGGERRRVELARILFGGADLLLLDEPTNHLDADAKEWLLGFLRAYRGALVVVSHDLALLDQSITRVMHLERGDGEGRLVEYRGTYSAYLAARAADETRAEKVAARQAAEVERLSGLADKMRHQSSQRARTAKSIDRRVERLRATTEAPTAVAARRVRLRLPDPPRSGRTVVQVQGLTKAFGSTVLFRDVGFSLGRGERLLVLGLNGAGKTTLLRMLAGEVPSDAGTVAWGLDVSTGYYAQEHEGIEHGTSALDHLRQAGDLSEQQLRALLGMMGLSPEVAAQAAGTMSGGEKTKLALAQLVAARNNVLLLDEPTNNLDPASRLAIGGAFAEWGGSMIVVSHDPELVEALRPDLVLVMPEGTVDRWSDDMGDLVALA